jgi:hypothetical protein
MQQQLAAAQEQNTQLAKMCEQVRGVYCWQRCSNYS